MWTFILSHLKFHFFYTVCINFISVQHVIPNPETDGTQAPSDVRAQPAQLEWETHIMEEDPDAGPGGDSDARPDDGYLEDDDESDGDAPLAQSVSILAVLFTFARQLAAKREANLLKKDDALKFSNRTKIFSAPIHNRMSALAH